MISYRAIVRIFLSGAAAAISWWAGILIVFGPAQMILADPARQSSKFLAVFSQPPLPRVAETAAVLPLGLLVIGIIHACVFEFLGKHLPGGPLRRGVSFGLVAWALMVPWFEFYLPWNVMHEPFSLVLLEALCWLLVLMGVGLIISIVSHRLQRMDRPPSSQTI